MAGAAIADVTMDQGSTYGFQGYVTILTDPTIPYNALTNPYIPFDFTGYTAISEIRDSAGTAAAQLKSTNIDRIALNTPSVGYFTLTIAAGDTTNWVFSSTSPDQYNGVWDIIMIGPTKTIKPFTGAWNINRLISR